jgi:4-amino-4-deoxy-L-arabinose transferase-like glycosyltransferase
LITSPLTSPQTAPSLAPAERRLWSPRSIAILVLAWLILQIGGLFTPGLLDDVDSVYIEIAREMLHRHDYVTPYINGIRFFDKPPLMYWMAAGSMHLLGIHDWAARLPLALAVLALLLAVYALGIRLFAAVSPSESPDRGGFYAALALATSIGPYLYTRFYIPDIFLALWMTLAVHLFLIALDRTKQAMPKVRVPRLRDGFILAKVGSRESDPLSSTQPQDRVAHVGTFGHWLWHSSALLPCLAFAAVMAANVLTKGLIGLVFPIGFVLLYLAVTKQLHLLLRLHPIASAAAFLALAAPWHILAAVRNPAIALPPGLGLPTTGGWTWFYLYNEHIARFLSRRIPHDYGQTPIWLFWLFTVIWIMPWAAFIPASIPGHIRSLRHRQALLAAHSRNNPAETIASLRDSAITVIKRNHQAAITLLLWTGMVLGFFTLSARQEYYGLPAIPALALLAAGALAIADNKSTDLPISGTEIRRSILRWSAWLLLPLGAILALVCGYYALTAPHPAPGTDIISLLAMTGGTESYNLSLSHMSDLTARAMGLFRGPLTATAFGMLAVGPISYLLRRRRLTYAANLTLAAAMTLTLLAAHEGLARFYPILGSKPLAEAINHTRQTDPQPNDLIIIDGELTSGSSLIFYTGQQVHLLNGRVNGLWYGSFWPDAPAIFETESTLRQLWSSPRRIFLFTYNPTARTQDLAPYGSMHTLASAGGKTILTNH